MTLNHLSLCPHKILNDLDGRKVVSVNVKLGGNVVSMLDDHWPSLALDKDHVVLLHCVKVCDVGRVRVPLILTTHDELIRNPF